MPRTFTPDTVQQAAFANAEKTAIYCTVKFVELPDAHMFTATADDPESYGVQLFNDLTAGKYGAVAPYAPPSRRPLSVDDLMAYLQSTADAVAANGVAITLADNTTPVQVGTTPSGLAFLHSLVLSAMVDPAFTVEWFQLDGTITLTAKQVLALNKGVVVFTGSVFAVRQQGRLAINAATPTITAYEQIAALPWPKTILGGNAAALTFTGATWLT